MSKPEENVQVCVRCRPINEREKKKGSLIVTNIDSKLKSVTIWPSDEQKKDIKQFTFDSVFDQDSTQIDVYNGTAKKIVDSVLDGFNGTVFVYGQTGTGKTFSMQGDKNVPHLRGIIPNTFNHIFDHVSQTPDKRFLVRCSFLEIYNEDIRDLLQVSNKKLELKEDSEGTVYVKDLNWVVVKSPQEMDKLMATGNKARSVGATLMNEQSSRSHCIFSITVESSQVGSDGEEHFRVGKLNLVDLAGSERQSKTGATGERLKEATKINLSLSALGNCISALVDSKATHVPYRDSKLTRLLQDSLGGNAKTLMIATISPSSYNFEESLSTLRYANRAKSIKNKPVINEDPKDAMLREFEQEITRLRKLLEGKKQNPSLAPNGNNFSKQLSKTLSQASLMSTSTSSSSLAKDMGGEGVRTELEEDAAEAEALKQQLESETAALLANKNLAEGERAKLQEAFEQRMLELETQRMEKLELQSKLMEMENQLLTGGDGNIETHIAKQEAELGLIQDQLSTQRQKQEDLRQKLDLQKEKQMQLEGNFATLQEEVQVNSQKLESALGRLDSLKSEFSKTQEHIIGERNELLDTIRSLNIEIQLRTAIIDSFIPPRQKDRLMARAHYSEEDDQWHLGELEKGQEATLPKMSCDTTLLVNRPISQFAKISMALGDPGIRYKSTFLVSPKVKTSAYRLPFKSPADFVPYPLYDSKLQAMYVSGLYQMQGNENRVLSPGKKKASSGITVEVTARNASEDFVNIIDLSSSLSSAPQSPVAASSESFPASRNLVSPKHRYA